MHLQEKIHQKGHHIQFKTRMKAFFFEGISMRSLYHIYVTGYFDQSETPTLYIRIKL